MKEPTHSELYIIILAAIALFFLGLFIGIGELAIISLIIIVIASTMGMLKPPIPLSRKKDK